MSKNIIYREKHKFFLGEIKSGSLIGKQNSQFCTEADALKKLGVQNYLAMFPISTLSIKKNALQTVQIGQTLSGN